MADVFTKVRHLDTGTGTQVGEDAGEETQGKDNYKPNRTLPPAAWKISIMLTLSIFQILTSKHMRQHCLLLSQSVCYILLWPHEQITAEIYGRFHA